MTYERWQIQGLLQLMQASLDDNAEKNIEALNTFIEANPGVIGMCIESSTISQKKRYPYAYDFISRGLLAQTTWKPESKDEQLLKLVQGLIDDATDDKLHIAIEYLRRHRDELDQICEEANPFHKRRWPEAYAFIQNVTTTKP